MRSHKTMLDVALESPRRDDADGGAAVAVAGGKFSPCSTPWSAGPRPGLALAPSNSHLVAATPDQPALVTSPPVSHITPAHARLISSQKDAAIRAPSHRSSRGHAFDSFLDEDTDRDSEPEKIVMIRQLDARAISKEQLVGEVKGVYAGLVMVESKCIEVSNSQTTTGAALTQQQWQAMNALHKTLLHEHHDFFLASQHPAGSAALRNLAAKYAMAPRMWRHGIHSFLELLRQRLPASLDHMLAFLYHAYGLLGVFLETVPAFRETWIECLGDLARYRMVIDDDARDHELWTATAAGWYSKASDLRPTVGRLSHHLAILARANPPLQLAFYLKALCVREPFTSSRESVQTLLNTAMKAGQGSTPATSEQLFVLIHAIIIKEEDAERLAPSMAEFVNTLPAYIESRGRRWTQFSYVAAISNICAITGYGEPSNRLFKALQTLYETDKSEDADVAMDDGTTAPQYGVNATLLTLFSQTLRAVLSRPEDDQILPYVIVTLSFILCIAPLPDAMVYMEGTIDWSPIVDMLNVVVAREPCDFSSEEVGYAREASDIPEVEDRPVCLPEDWFMRGLLFTANLFPRNFFNCDVDYQDKMFEGPLVPSLRRRRVLHLGYLLAQRGLMQYSVQTRQFFL